MATATTPTEATPGTPQVHTLSNGVTYIRVDQPGAETVQVQIMVRAGSRDESPATAGYAHCLEHFFFKGARGYPTSFAIDDRIERNGGQTNAFTSNEMVSYFAAGLRRHVRSLARVITRMVTEPTFPPAEWPHERQTVLDELAKGAANNGQWLWDSLFGVAFGGDQALAWSAGGLIPVVENSQVSALVDYHRRFYDPTQTALVICGGATLEPAEAEAMMAAMPHGTRGPRQPARWGEGAPFAGKPVDVAQTGDHVQMLLTLPGHQLGSDAASESDEIAEALLAAVLGGGESSRLRVLSRRSPRVFADVECESHALTDAGLFMVAIETNPAHQAEAAARALAELRRVTQVPVSDAELRRASMGMTTQLLRATETPEGLTTYYAGRWGGGQQTITPEQLVARIRAVTPAQLQRAAVRLTARIPDVRFTFIHPSDPVTGLNSRGQTVDQAGTEIRAAAIAPRGMASREVA